MCGLTYLNPVMTAEAYAQFYAGTYRQLVEIVSNRPYDPATLEKKQGMYGSRLATLLKFSGCAGEVDLLDAGGSTGAVAAEVHKALPMRSVTVLDPSAEELARASAHGFQTIHGTLEGQLATRTYGAALCAQTLDHLLDPMGALQFLRASCSGWLWVDIVECGYKIDHPLYWTKKALAFALHETGWKIKRSERFDFDKRFGVICV